MRGRFPRGTSLLQAARELGVDLKALEGAAAGTVTDVERAAGGGPARAASPAPGGMRAAIAAAMSRSKREIPHYYLTQTVQLAAALAR